MSDAPERIWATHDLRNGYYFTASGPQLRFEDVEYVRADRIEELETENHLLKTSGIIEVAARNPNVMEYMRHWEGRAEAAEAELPEQIEWVKSLADDLIASEGREARLKEKLHKCVGALGDISNGEPEWPDDPQKELDWCRNRATATLAQLTGGKDE